MKKTLKVLKIVFTSLFLFIFILLGIGNVAKGVVCSTYNKVKKTERKIIGLNDGFVPQGLGYNEEKNLIFQSGYFKKDNHCVIYITNSSGKTKKVYVNIDQNTKYTGHFGGIASYKDFVYVSEDFEKDGIDYSNRLYIFSLNDLLDENKDTVFIDKYIEIEEEGACVSISDGYLYTGEFYSAGSYETKSNHHITNPNNITQPALVSAYRLDETKENGLGDVEFQISVPKAIQGFTIKDDTCIISTSWGPLPSKMNYYHLDRSKTIDNPVSGVPLYYIDETCLIKSITMPAMSEGIYIKDNRVNVYFESAGNKYVFGKFFNDFYQVSLPIYSK